MFSPFLGEIDKIENDEILQNIKENINNHKKEEINEETQSRNLQTNKTEIKDNIITYKNDDNKRIPKKSVHFIDYFLGNIE